MTVLLQAPQSITFLKANMYECHAYHYHEMRTMWQWIMLQIVYTLAVEELTQWSFHISAVQATVFEYLKKLTEKLKKVATGFKCCNQWC